MTSIHARAEGGLSLEVADSGKLRVSLSGDLVAEGLFSAEDGAADFGLTGAALGPSQSVQVTRESDSRSRCLTTFRDAVLDLVFSLAGEDLTVTATFTNRHPFGGPTFRSLKFGGLVVSFAKPPKGMLPSWHYTYLRHEGQALMHPSTQVQLGAAFAADDTLGVAVHLPSHIRRRKLVCAGFDGNFQNVIPPRCTLWIYTDDETPPQAATQTITSIRFSRNTDWRHLLIPYRAELAHEPLAYEPDQRPLARFSSVDPAKVSPENPYGFNGDFRRFDRADGVNAFLKMTANPLAQAGALGCIFWAIQGHNPRGAMYRPDFDVFPPQIDALLPLLIKGFKARGLRVGLATRPAESVERQTWKQDTTVPIRATAKEHIARTLARFKWATDRGFDLFYLDSFGNTYDHYLIMRELRAALGPKVLCWAEFTSDIMLPLAGRYTEWQGADLILHSHALAEIFQWLVPGSSYVVYDRGGTKDAPRPALSADQYAQRRYTPMIEDFEVQQRLPDLNLLRTERLQGKEWAPPKALPPSPKPAGRP